MIDVLVVEDSRVTREYLESILEADPAIRRVSAVESGEAALEFLTTNRVDVILMDIHLPGIDGFETTRRIMTSNPVPIVVCTGSTRFNGVNTAMNTLGAGALSLVKKPGGYDDPDADSEAATLVETLKLMSEITVVRRWDRRKSVATATVPPAYSTSPFDTAASDVAVVAIGASTGGPPALLSILSGLGAGFPAPILVVQHITAGFTSGLASWLRFDLRLTRAYSGETGSSRCPDTSTSPPMIAISASAPAESCGQVRTSLRTTCDHRWGSSSARWPIALGGGRWVCF